MSGAGPLEGPWDEAVARPQMLTEAETTELELALQDGFQIHGSMMPGEKYRLDGIVEEPFFGASAGSSSEVPAVAPDLISKLRSKGFTEEEALDEFRDFLDEQVSEDAPDWQDTNPFGFSFSPISAFFKKQLCTYWGIEVEDFDPNLVSLTSDAYLPFSRTWFEVQILDEVSYFYYNFSDIKELESQTDASPGTLWGRTSSLSQAFKSAGKVGRMVEHYRWRFSYGQDALRGRASVMAARAGGVARAKLSKSASAVRIEKMRQFIEAGHSRARAAELAHKAGFGPSKEANRKLWARYMRANPER